MHDATKRCYLCLFIALAVVGVLADQTSKYIVFAKLYPHETEYETRVVVVPGLFDLRTIHSWEPQSSEGNLSFLRTISGARVPHVNKGALFGIGNDGSGMNGFFAVVSLLAAGFIVYWVQRPAVANDRFLCLALGLILGGTLGNLYDRIVFGGVRDFLHWYYDTHVWPDFNLADCCLVCGAGVLLAHSFFVNENAPESSPTEAVSAGAPMQTTTTSGL